MAAKKKETEDKYNYKLESMYEGKGIEEMG